MARTKQIQRKSTAQKDAEAITGQVIARKSAPVTSGVR
jgi:hypothetical protein